jgi:hypothetical protein
MQEINFHLINQRAVRYENLYGELSSNCRLREGSCYFNFFSRHFQAGYNMLLFNDSVNESAKVMNATNTTAKWQIIGPSWTFIPIFYIVVIFFALVSNGSVMLAFICRRNIRTSFNIYLMNLCTANFLYAIIQNPADVINHLYSGNIIAVTVSQETSSYFLEFKRN